MHAKKKAPSFIGIIANQLQMNLHQNSGNSWYKIPKVSSGKRSDWKFPFGTLRLSDHWNIWKNSGTANIRGKVTHGGYQVFNTDQVLKDGQWALCLCMPGAWKVISILELDLQKQKGIFKIVDHAEISVRIETLLSLKAA